MLVGLAVGLAALILVTFVKERRYRLLFSDVHLGALVEAMSAAAAAPGTPATTFGGIGLEWRALKLHAALVITPKGRLAPEALRFLMGVMAAAMQRTPTAALVLDGRRYALVVPGGVPEVAGTALEPTWRAAGVEAIRGLPVVPGSLAAWE
ncbi:MAG: hypothetical protein U1F43_14975 [Myxococcota bacterium]